MQRRIPQSLYGLLGAGIVIAAIAGWSAVLVMFATFAAIMLVWVLFRRLLPAKKSPLLAGLSAREMSHLFALAEGAGATYFLFLILSVPAITLLLYLGSTIIKYLRPAPDSGFFVPWYFWIIVALPAGFVAAYYVARPILRRELGPEYEATAAYEERSIGFDFAKAMNFVIAPCVLAACVFLIFLGVSFHVELNGRTFAIHDLFSLRERTYTVDQITDIFTAPAFWAPDRRAVDRRVVVHRRIYVMFFADGTSWNTRHFDRDDDQIKLGAVLRLTAARAGITIAETPILRPPDL